MNEKTNMKKTPGNKAFPQNRGLFFFWWFFPLYLLRRPQTEPSSNTAKRLSGFLDEVLLVVFSGVIAAGNTEGAEIGGVFVFC